MAHGVLLSFPPFHEIETNVRASLVLRRERWVSKRHDATEHVVRRLGGVLRDVGFARANATILGSLRKGGVCSPRLVNLAPYQAWKGSWLGGMAEFCRENSKLALSAGSTTGLTTAQTRLLQVLQPLPGSMATKC